MGPIADRIEGRLGASDVAVVEFRRLMVEAARADARRRARDRHDEPHIPHATISSFEGVVPKIDQLAQPRRRQRSAADSVADAAQTEPAQ